MGSDLTRASMPLLGRRSDNPRQAGISQAGVLPAGKTDLLLRFFDSTFFDEWIALTCAPSSLYFCGKEAQQ